MDFGFGLGDFITIIQLVNDVRRRFVNAPSQFNAVSNDVKTLSNVLRDIEDLEEGLSLTSLQQSQLSQSCQRCWGVLNRLHDLVEKYQVIENTSDGVRKGIRRVWKRVQWDQSEVDEIHQHLSAQIDYFVLFLAGVNAHAASEMKVMTATMKTGVDRLNRDQDEIARQGILDWLTPVNYAAQQRDFFGRRKKDTGQWLLDAAEFQKWVGCPNQVLYCPGIPGAGKTILMSTVNDYLSQKYLDDGAVATAYVFCSFRRHHEQSPLQLFAGLLKQLASRCKPLPECLRQSYKKHTGDSLPGLDEIIDLLVSVLNGYKRAFFVVDALDECPVSDGSQHIFIEKLLQLQKVTESNLLTTSRPDQSISDCFKGSMFVDIRADDADVAKYLNSEMFRLPACASRNPDLQIEIKSVIIKAVQGMFLLAQLYLDSLIGKRSPKAIRTALQNLPLGNGAYNYAYNEAMQRIIQQDVDSAELATQVLGWVAFAKRPLTTTEIRHALAIELGSSDLDPDNIPDIADISSVCGGLVTVDEGSNIIRLVHYTTQEYFERTWQSWFPDAHRDITDTLITYLLFDEFGSGSCDKDEEFDARLRTYPFYEYASRHWGNHARSLWNDHLGNAFLQNKSKISSSAQALFVSKWRIWDTNYSQRVPKQTTAMHLTAYFGLTDILNDLVAQGMPCDSLDSFRQTPLFLAAMSGHESVVSLLLERGAKPDSRDYYNRSPLYRAAWNGREAISRVLLGHGADPNPVDRHGGTPLLRAAWSGHDAIVRLLLEKGADANLMNKFGRSALSYAAWAGHDKVVRILLDHGAEPNTQDIEFRQSPLLGAAWHGYLEIVQLLLENGANPEVKDSKLEMTPLEAAVDRGYEEVVKILERSKNGEQNELISN